MSFPLGLHTYSTSLNTERQKFPAMWGARDRGWRGWGAAYGLSQGACHSPVPVSIFSCTGYMLFDTAPLLEPPLAPLLPPPLPPPPPSSRDLPPTLFLLRGRVFRLVAVVTTTSAAVGVGEDERRKRRNRSRFGEASGSPPEYR